ncbi:MAG: hypothetical protein ABIA37_05000 [Candidatus Woesearchaeota archaeon]
MIDWDKVPQERLEEAKHLDQRVSNIETGYVDGYNNLVARIGEVAKILTVVNKEELVQVWIEDTARLKRIYEELDFDEMPRIRDTEPYFACRQYYRECFQEYIQQFASGLESGDVNLDLADSLAKWSKEICEQGSRIPRNISRDLQSIPGCEKRTTKWDNFDEE